MTRRSMKQLKQQFGLFVSRMAANAILPFDTEPGFFLDDFHPEKGYRVVLKYRKPVQTLASLTDSALVDQSVFGEYTTVTELYNRIEHGILAINAYRLLWDKG